MTGDTTFITPEFTDLIEYNTHWRGGQPFFMREEDYSKYIKSWDYIKRYYPNLRRSVGFHPTEPGVEGVLIGTEDSIKDAEIAEKLGLTSAPIIQKAPLKGKAKGSDHYKSKYPWHNLQKIGDNFLVINSRLTTVSVAASMRSRTSGDQYKYKTHEREDGILVICVKAPGSEPTEIVNGG